MEQSKYYWTPESPMSIDDYLMKRRPSIVTMSDAFWIWVGQATEHDPEEQSKKLSQAIEEGSVIVRDLTKRVQEIEKDDKIPVRGKKGVLSKKQTRDEAQQLAAVALREISLESGCTNGKWMMFPRPDNVDAVWSKVARSVAYGPLHDAGVHTAKVSPSDPDKGEHGTHVVIVYVDNIYDKDMATKVLVSLLEDHGLEPSASKSDLYTMLDIDSKHPSGLRSSIWRPSELVPTPKALTAKYKPGSEKKWVRKDEPAPKGKAAGKSASQGSSKASSQEAGKRPNKARSKEASPEKGLHKEVSFSDEVEVETRKRSPVKQNGRPAKRVKSAAALFKENDIFASDSEDD